ncbi:PREDICTED: Bardet-Biedl syndrome 12 protein [Nestor notabilis]|uniref:Bardet-Biedl syndrome 12 protein n=1 Tax=Nestor notabilis TaxID=176057 RepID=UPI0005235192|nr:PREDICTED: Bardet-Biedl syndrome 12 protein [Nestor notabilis]
MAFRDVNARRHIGLQQLSSLALAGRTLLGPVKSCKFIVDESTNQSTLICSAVRLIESLDLTSAAGQLLNETIHAQNKEFKTGMSTLLFLVGAWSNAIMECLQQNVPVSAIVSVMSEGLNSCCEEVQCLQISIHDHLVLPLAGFGSVASLVKPVGDRSTSVISRSGVTTSSGNKQKLTHSRYFSTLGKSHFSSQQGNFQGYLLGPSADSCECHGLGHLAMALSHGNETSMKPLQSILTYQQERAEHSGSSQFNVAGIVTCCLPGLPESYSCASPGFVTLVSPEQVTVIKHLEDKLLRILLIDGDLTEQYRHLGFNRSCNVRTIVEHPNLQEEDLWLSSVLDNLINFEVNLVLVKGNVCENLMERCIANSILLVSSVTWNVLCSFGEVTGAQPVTYLTQLNPSCVGSGAQVELWKAHDGRAVDLGELVPVRIKARGIPLLTAVLTTTIASKMQLLEDQFWTLVYRLHHALNDKKVFLGGGAVELLCLSHIQMLAQQPLQPANQNAVKEFHSPWLAASATEYKSIVLQALASGWKQYLLVVMCNTTAASELEACTSVDHHLRKAADCGSPSAYILKEFRRGDLLRDGAGPFAGHGEGLKVYDNVTAKTEAWRRALDLVLLVLQTDAEIITGPRKNQLLNSHVSGEFMFL